VTSGSISGRHVLVIGASSGIGAAFARSCLESGAHVVVSARRAENLAATVRDFAFGHVAPGDATSGEDMKRVAETARDAIGEIDLMLYAAGFGVLQPLEETEIDTWQAVYAANVIGANLATAAVLPHLSDQGVCAYLSSRTTGDANALFASYSASKAALDQCIRTWRTERSDHRFVRVVMGNTQPTEFANHMGVDLLGAALRAWEIQAIPGGMMDVHDLAGAMKLAFGGILDHPEIDQPDLRFDARP